ncbi:sugar phosphate isomerase/epimerase family protein [Enterobacter roggenkampii]|uniref:sugar phosphate isomerase/epimerase family protein n=1 Tax=Enterobacter roggenkampii TaxID=1812935 RepID=UPI002DBB198A|nr:TIM barrel protein [Enterobacter roggenkampii]MEB6618515.1 sugar phosphate isomerase/epimerase [Enterobacter roggenkampii]
MRISFSNLAWDVNEDAKIVSLLKEHHVDAIDIAPGKYFPIPAEANKKDILAVKNWWGEHGIEIIGMQSLLFGTTGLNVFSTDIIQNLLLKHLAEICRIGSILGATRLVFGSPKNRDCSGLTAREVQSVSQKFFRQLGNIADDHGVIICLEPNPAIYGANFMTTTFNTYEVVRNIDHPSIKMQLDTGAVIANNENIITCLENVSSMVGHVHISEPYLVPPGDTYGSHSVIASALQKYISNYPITIEMLATQNEPHIASVSRALQFVSLLYR